MATSRLMTNGADVLVTGLKKLGVNSIFAITGAGNLAIIDALVRDGSISVIYSHHEQAAIMEAQGYARTTNGLGVAIVTTGGGTSNTVTGMLSAHLDSIPVLLISGNESSFHCENNNHLRAYGVQGFDSCAVLRPIVKSSTRILDVEEIMPTLLKSAQCSLSDRKGPTHIDFPMDLQRKTSYLTFANEISSIEMKPPQTNLEKLDGLISAILDSRRPMFYFGNGIRSESTIQAARAIIEKTGIPFVLSWSAIDLFPESYELNIGRVGIYGDRHANILIQKSDLVVAIGTRLAIPQTGYDKADFARKATIWVVDIDKTECAKFEGLGWNIVNEDAMPVLEHLNNSEWSRNQRKEWISDCKRVKNALPRREQVGPQPTFPESQIHSADVISFLNQSISPDAIVVTDVGAALLTGHYMFEQTGERRFFTSQGLGEMGFGLPASIGAHFADKSRQIICLNTDGAMMFNLQELQLVKEHRIPLKLFIFNNLGYSMIKISQENLFEGRTAGSTTHSGLSFPDFRKVADTFDFGYTAIRNLDELSGAILALKTEAPELVEVFMDPEQKYFPRLATNKLSDGALVSPPIEDLDPKIDIKLLEELLGYPAHPNSYKVRGMI